MVMPHGALFRGGAEGRFARTFHAWAEGEVRAGGAGRRDRAQRLEPEHHRYVDTAEEEERIDVAAAVRKLERERAAAEATMNRYLAELGYGEADGLAGRSR